MEKCASADSDAVDAAFAAAVVVVVVVDRLSVAEFRITPERVGSFR